MVENSRSIRTEIVELQKLVLEAVLHPISFSHQAFRRGMPGDMPDRALAIERNTPFI
jgi:hypothetical protein